MKIQDDIVMDDSLTVENVLRNIAIILSIDITSQEELQRWRTCTRNHP